MSNPHSSTALESVEMEQLRARVRQLEADNGALLHRVRQDEARRRAMIHIMGDLHQVNRRLADQRKAMIHILGDLHETTTVMRQREQRLFETQEQLIQAAKLATLGELATEVAHELNNPLNNIALFIGNTIDLIELGKDDKERMLRELNLAMQQGRKATEIISHLCAFGRAAPVSHEILHVNHVIERALSLMQEQLRLRQIDVELDLPDTDPLVLGNAIQLEQVFINLLMNARDALVDRPRKSIAIDGCCRGETFEVRLSDTGPGIIAGLEQRIFDPFFTTKKVGTGTGLGLSITNGIIKDHHGTIAVENHPGEGATFILQLPLVLSENERNK